MRTNRFSASEGVAISKEGDEGMQPAANPPARPS